MGTWVLYLVSELNLWRWNKLWKCFFKKINWVDVPNLQFQLAWIRVLSKSNENKITCCKLDVIGVFFVNLIHTFHEAFQFFRYWRWRTFYITQPVPWVVVGMKKVNIDKPKQETSSAYIKRKNSTLFIQSPITSTRLHSNLLTIQKMKFVSRSY